MSIEYGNLYLKNDAGTLREMLECMKRSKLVRYEVLVVFERYKEANKDLIAQYLANQELSEKKEQKEEESGPENEEKK